MYGSARRYSYLWSFAGIIVLTGCASSAPLSGGLSTGPSIASSGSRTGDALSAVPEFKAAERATTNVPISDAWARLAKAYSDLGIPLTTVQADAHILGNEGMKRSHTLANQRLSSMLECGDSGGGANADIYSINMSVISRLSPTTANGTEVATLVQATATPMAFGTAPIVCSTTGRLEARIASMVSGNTSTK